MVESTESKSMVRGADRQDGVSGALRKLRPIEEKVVRLRYDLGCQRAHSAEEIAAAFGVGLELVEAILEEAEQRLGQDGVRQRHLKLARAQALLSRHRSEYAAVEPASERGTTGEGECLVIAELFSRRRRIWTRLREGPSRRNRIGRPASFGGEV